MAAGGPELPGRGGVAGGGELSGAADAPGGREAEGGAPPERARLFVALDLPSQVRAVLTGWAGQRLAGHTGLRLIDQRSLHVTLCFLGWRSVDEVAEIAAACRASTPREEIPLSLASALWLPPRRPRVAAVELVDTTGALARLQAALSDALAAGGFYEPEDRAFLGHVTVARVGRGAGRFRSFPLPPPKPLRFAAEAVTLYRSRLGSGGARYEPLAAVPLPRR